MKRLVLLALLGWAAVSAYAGKYVRIRTVNTAGTPTFTMGTAQEVFYN